MLIFVLTRLSLSSLKIFLLLLLLQAASGHGPPGASDQELRAIRVTDGAGKEQGRGKKEDEEGVWEEEAAVPAASAGLEVPAEVVQSSGWTIST